MTNIVKKFAARLATPLGTALGGTAGLKEGHLVETPGATVVGGPSSNNKKASPAGCSAREAFLSVPQTRGEALRDRSSYSHVTAGFQSSNIPAGLRRHTHA